MKKNLKVKITYRNAKLEPVDTQMYDFESYTEILRNDLVKLIADVENAFYIVNGNAPKDKWPDEVWGAFMRIKHKLLDKAGAIGRLPENIMEGGEEDGCDMEKTIRD